MSRNKSFAADLAGAIDRSSEAPSSPGRVAIGVLAGRGNRLADLASGAIVPAAQELVDPARCRMWAGHNRDYAALSEERCHDLIESLKAQGRQEVAAIVRRVQGDANYDFEVICGARRHWSVSWLRGHNYPQFRFLVDVRSLTDEEAFRLSDLENRARRDISDFERARDYLQALGAHYEGVQTVMAERLKVSPSWLSRYLDLARLPTAVLEAFPNPHELAITHIQPLKPLLKAPDKRERVLAEAGRLKQGRARGEPVPAGVPEIIRALQTAGDAPTRSGTPKRSGVGGQVYANGEGKPMMRVERRSRTELTVTLLGRGGQGRADLEQAFQQLLDDHWR